MQASNFHFQASAHTFHFFKDKDDDKDAKAAKQQILASKQDS